ncbi:MAG: rhodanese-like domain-containing protein [Desulfobacteraceae bacterium]|jgi:rhodanese-related sulfurtransferase/rubrerythrin
MRIKDLSPEALRQFIQDHHEKEYALIDVRQPGEYEHGHIPGARLIPLPELVQTMEALPRDKKMVFYCHSGARSMAAASMVAEENIGSGDLLNLAGGMLAWDGGVAEDYPNARLFPWQAAPSEMLKTAMNLEKGALHFYTHVSEQYQDQPWVKVFVHLAKEELGHARTVYRFWRQIETDGGEFHTVFEALSGEVLEGGIKLSEAMNKLVDIKNRVCLRLIEMALSIEYAAFDLYRTMADRITAPDAQEAFITIAQAEKAHMRSLAKAIEHCG